MIDYYVATPYSHPSPDIRAQRYIRACQAMARLMKHFHKNTFFGPITHSHGIAVYGCIKTDWETWARHDQAMIDACKSVLVVQMDGWKTSKGIRAEIEYAESKGKGFAYWDINRDPVRPVILTTTARLLLEKMDA